MRILVYHGGYGCGTGCCGHRIASVTDSAEPDYGWLDPDERIGGEKFTFSHPYDDDHLEWAKQLVREEFGEEHVADLDWEHSLISED